MCQLGIEIRPHSTRKNRNIWKNAKGTNFNYVGQQISYLHLNMASAKSSSTKCRTKPQRRRFRVMRRALVGPRLHPVRFCSGRVPAPKSRYGNFNARLNYWSAGCRFSASSVKLCRNSRWIFVSIRRLLRAPRGVWSVSGNFSWRRELISDTCEALHYYTKRCPICVRCL